jgi:trimethylamine--corrinoid protein Co-methyltransferase
MGRCAGQPAEGWPAAFAMAGESRYADPDPAHPPTADCNEEVSMIQSAATHQRTPFVTVLTEDQIHEIKRAAFDIMGQVGFNVLHEGARHLLRQAGARVRDEHVRVPEFIVNECVAKAPKGFTVYDRTGRRALEVEGRKSWFGTSTASPNTKDALTGDIHPTRVADIATGARVADWCPHIDWVMPMGSSQDVPALAADLHEFEAVVTHTTKPIVFIGYSPRGAELVYEMAAAVAGGLDDLQAKPFLLLYPEPISPLVQPADVVDRIFTAADLMMPQIPGPAVLVGGTGPVTLAGTVALLTAESLMCLVLAQLRRPGCPVCLSANVQILDMATGLFGVGAPEMSLGLAAQAEVARSFGLPTWGYAGCTDAKTVDAQAGMEAAFSIVTQALAGLNLIHDVGYLDMAMVCSPAQLLLGNEAIGMAKRYLQGITVDAITLARDVVAAVGPGGNFLEQPHTHRHFRRELSRHDLATRQPRPEWQAAGGLDMAQRIQHRLERILAEHQIPPLAGDIRGELERIRINGEEELTAAD